jgi:CHAT domain-containing protein/Tfp pilus assembly protein PilF
VALTISLALVGYVLVLAAPPCQAGDTPRQAKLRQAAALQKKVEQLRQAHRPVEAAGALVDLGNICLDLGDLAAARQHYEAALAIFRAKLPKDDPRIANSLYNLGIVLQNVGDLPGARKYYEQSVAMYRATLPKDDPRIAVSLNNLGIVLKALGDLAGARQRYEEALAIYRATLRKNDPRIANSLMNLGNVLQILGDLAGARQHHEAALAMYRATLPKDGPRIAGSLNSLGSVLWELGDLAGARQHFEEALAISRATLPRDDPRIAQSLYNLGIVLQSLRELTGARKHCQEALAMYRATLPKDDPRIADCLFNLGVVLRASGDPAEARKCIEGALAIFRAKLPKDDPRLAYSLYNLGIVLWELGDLPGARERLEQALPIYRAILPNDHPSLIFPLNGLMVLERRAGHAAKALGYLEELTHLDLVRQERDGLARSEREQLTRAARFGPTVDLLLQELLRAQRVDQAYDLVVAAKGAVTARQRWLRLQRDLTDSRASKLLEDLRSVDSRLLNLGLESAKERSQMTINLGEQLPKLTRRREELERELIAVSPAFRAEKQRVRRGLKDIGAALPANGVLLDFVEYVPVRLDPQTGKEETEAARLGAFVVRPGPQLHWVDLGTSQQMAELIDRWRAGHGASRPAAKQPIPAAELRRLLWGRLEPHVKGANLILVAPEGPLNGLPLAALPGRKPDSYLLEEHAFVHIPTSQQLPDLVGKTDPRFERPVSMLLVGDVDFGSPGDFPRLPGTAAEINHIRAKFHDSFASGWLSVLRQGEASKRAFAAASGRPRYLHLATHGFFANPAVKSVFAPENRARAVRTALGFDLKVVGEHPGLLSGLVFAGANRKGQKGEAILTALEVSEMELRGVELVVLSACETGLGRVAGGEGVLGLQRSFQVAGARTVVASLWKVPDRPTQVLMQRFYQNLWQKKMGKVAALREAQLWMLREGPQHPELLRGLDLPEEGRLPPYAWAAFVLSGDWR